MEKHHFLSNINWFPPLIQYLFSTSILSMLLEFPIVSTNRIIAVSWIITDRGIVRTRESSKLGVIHFISNPTRPFVTGISFTSRFLELEINKYETVILRICLWNWEIAILNEQFTFSRSQSPIFYLTFNLTVFHSFHRIIRNSTTPIEWFKIPQLRLNDSKFHSSNATARNSTTPIE